MKRFCLLAAAIIHLAMLASLLDHFQPGSQGNLLEPVLHEAAPVRGLLPQSRTDPQDGHWLERRHHQAKQARLRSRGLMALPRRETTNRGLDRLIRDITRTDPGGDFFQLYASGVALRLGVSVFEEPTPGVSPELLAQVRNSAPLHPPNRYPPVVAQTLGRFLATLGTWNAYWLWILIHEAVWFWTLALGSRLVEREDRAWVWAAGLAFLPWYAELYMGQTTFLVCWSVIATVAWLQRTQRGTAAGAWGLGLIIKPLGLLLAPVLIGPLGLGRLLLAVLVPVAASAPYFWSHPEELRLFVGWAFGQELPPGVGSCAFQNLVHHLTVWDPVVPLVTVAGIGASLLATWRGRSRLPLGVALWVATYFMVYAHVWEHHYILVIPLVILLLAGGCRRAAAILFALTAAPSLFWLLGDRLSWARETLYIAWKALPMVWIYGFLLRLRLRGESG